MAKILGSVLVITLKERNHAQVCVCFGILRIQSKYFMKFLHGGFRSIGLQGGLGTLKMVVNL
jgi:hypothetical protein